MTKNVLKVGSESLAIGEIQRTTVVRYDVMAT